MKVILHLRDDSHGTLALRAAIDLFRNGHKSCCYEYENGELIEVIQNKKSITAYEMGAK